MARLRTLSRGRPSPTQQAGPAQGESTASYNTGPQPPFGFPAPAGQEGFSYQTAAAPEAANGNGTGPQQAGRSVDQAAYGQPPAPPQEPPSYEASAHAPQAAPARDGQAYEQGYAGQGYAGQGYGQQAQSYESLVLRERGRMERPVYGAPPYEAERAGPHGP